MLICDIFRKMNSTCYAIKVMTHSTVTCRETPVIVRGCAALAAISSHSHTHHPHDHTHEAVNPYAAPQEYHQRIWQTPYNLRLFLSKNSSQ